jgi:hypothetical protein
MQTAQEAFDKMLREVIRPQMRASGLRGSGTNFVWPSDDYFAGFGIQKSDANSKTLAKFTINAMVISHADWEVARESRSYLPKRPSPNITYGSFYDSPFWHGRIGILMPDKRDKWWILDGSTNWSEVAAEVLLAINDYLLPEVRARVSDQPHQ